MILERRGAVVKPMALFQRDVAAPVRDLDVAFEERGVKKGFGELVANADFLDGACGELIVRAVGVGRALLLGVFLAICVELGGKGGCVRDVDARELELRLLLGCSVGAGSVGGEGVEDVLLIGLSNLGG